MRNMIAIAVLTIVSLPPVADLAAQDWGDLTVTFVYSGEVPKPSLLKVTTDIEYCGKFRVPDESLIVDEDKKGVANVVAFLYLGRGQEAPKPHRSYADSAEDKVLLDNKECRFDPHVTFLTTSQTLVIGNSDKVGHNCKVDTFRNAPINQTIAAGGNFEHKFDENERLPSRVSCSIHPWMSGWLLVKDSPYMAKSDEDGKLVIKNLPVGDWTIQFWHEKSGYVSEVTQDGAAKEWARGRLEVSIKAGANDLGKIELAPSLFAE